jgi:hypothetical protein
MKSLKSKEVLEGNKITWIVIHRVKEIFQLVREPSK